MFHQTGQHAEQSTGCPALSSAGVEPKSPRFEAHGLPSFVSAAPPRSEGEALLRRIFSRAERA